MQRKIQRMAARAAGFARRHKAVITGAAVIGTACALRAADGDPDAAVTSLTTAATTVWTGVKTLFLGVLGVLVASKFIRKFVGK